MIKEPESMDEVCYFSRRDLENGKGDAVAWVFKGTCPKCKKGKMGKPINPKTGKAKIRAKEYECPECGYIVEKEEYEDTLECEIKYTCPKCSHKGETTVPFKRKSLKLADSASGKARSSKAIVFICEKCNEKLGITKKMKE